jgi:hypothetical protein
MDNIVFWATYFAVAVICIFTCEALWRIAKSLNALSRRDITTNMHPIVLTLREIKEEIKQLTNATSMPRRCH